MTELFHDTNFWVLLSFTVFVVLAYRYGKDSVLTKLDGKIESIKTELEAAERLRVDAQELLAEYQQKHKNAMSEAATIIEEAKKRAENIKEKAEENLTQVIARREAQLDEKLARIEQNAQQDIQTYTAQIAINASRDLLSKNMDSKTDKAIISNMIENFSKTLN